MFFLSLSENHIIIRNNDNLIKFFQMQEGVTPTLIPFFIFLRQDYSSSRATAAKFQFFPNVFPRFLFDTFQFLHHFRSGGREDASSVIRSKKGMVNPPRARLLSPEGPHIVARVPRLGFCQDSPFVPPRREGSLEKVKWITQRAQGKINVLSCVWSHPRCI